MEASIKYNLCAVSAVLVVGCTVSYFVYKRKRKLRDAVEVFNNLAINVVATEYSCAQIVAELRRRCKKHKALGFDCEWVTEKGRRQPIALVQLSSYDGYCALFRLNCMKTMPESLKDLLEDKSIYKVGVAPTDDSKYLFHDYTIELKSTLDIRHLALLCGHEPGGLALLTANLLHAVLDKSWRIRCSNWEADELSDRQVNYAAIDAYVAIRIFVLLIEELGRKSFLLSNILRYSTENVWSRVDELCWKYADVHFKSKQSGRNRNDGSKDKDTKVYKDIAVSKRYAASTRGKPLYNNCCLQAPDGELLCTCDKKKALWYVDKQLADIVSEEEPFTVRLRFEPAGRSVGDTGRYYQQAKENKCVVCGSTNSYIRKNVVPREYRKIFPDIMKDHSSHDVVLLCASCHQRSNTLDQAVRDKLANMCGAPLVGKRKYTEDLDSKRIKMAARALLYQSQKHVLPESRRKELEELLLEHYPKHNEITEELLQEAANIQVMHENAEYDPHGVKVVEYFLQRDGLLRLEEIWREHFLTSMQPKHLPDLWSVKHNEERLRIKWNEGRLTQEHLKSIGLTRL